MGFMLNSGIHTQSTILFNQFICLRSPYNQRIEISCTSSIAHVETLE
jgi:hypothetical protein